MDWSGIDEWLARLEAEGDELVVATLQQVVDTPPDRRVAGAEALAAAEIVASCAGAAPDEVPDEVRRHVERCGVPSDERIALAFRAVERVAMQADEREAGLVDLEERLGALLAA
jgi:hypothetical protein